MTAKKVKAIKVRLHAGEGVGAIAAEYDVGYMAIYKIAIGETWKEVGIQGRLIGKREAVITPERRDWAARMKKKNGWTNAKIAQKLGVSDMTVSRILKDAEALLAEQVRSMLMTSGSNDAAMKKYGLDQKEAERLITLSAMNPLPKRLRRELES